MKSLIIVESPAKARTIKKFLNSQYGVKASMGHLRDLPKSQLGVDVEHDFLPKYITIKGRQGIIKELKKVAQSAKEVFLATDPDREGEAIAWHLSHLLSIEGKARRIELREITKEALKEALKTAHSLDLDKVNAQQARRILDRLVGYKLSPLLWRKVKGGLSAGRVQSVAVKLICDREQEIQAFVPQEYWSLMTRLFSSRLSAEFLALLTRKGKEKITISSQDEATAIVEELEKARFIVEKVSAREKKRHAPPPFMTSTLQQRASSLLGFRVTRTMRIAQELYEGLDLGPEGTVGLITYMRTDSLRISSQAQDEGRRYIVQRFGEDFSQPRFFKSRKGAQDAHEAIRPTSVFRDPEGVRGFLSPDQYKIYKLIWERFVASQMSPQLLEVKSAEISASQYLLKAAGSEVKFPGFSLLFEGKGARRSGQPGESVDQEESGLDGHNGKGAEESEREEEILDEMKEGGAEGPEEGLQAGPLPPLVEGEILDLRKCLPKQHFTSPPPRYTEATLVKTLEEKGIGRPSTYAPIIETIRARGYVELKEKAFRPTELGIVVTDLLANHFTQIMNVDFTAEMEDKLDRIENGELFWTSVLKEFYPPFEQAVIAAQAQIPKVKVEPTPTGEDCPSCGKPLVLRRGRFGEFTACSGYPKCQYVKPSFHSIGVKCPSPGCEGEVIQLRTKKGRFFFGCSKYPACQFRSWDKPSGSFCPSCSSPLFLRKPKTGRKKHPSEEQPEGEQPQEILVCLKEGCGGEVPLSASL